MSASPSQQLPPLDAHGAKLVAGMAVRILTIPQWLTHDLPSEDVDRLKKVEGTVRRITRIDANGYVWIEDWFCLRPTEVAVETQ